ncbi:hypothetical protein QAD02_000801 [Eretmocerus hayati]|uniref:Uncharacterized protein n=1 Tax=Eretmocerus hayati TaxID=131215 RepID=A0ACC2NEF6_9HYME|nr:hypothetical protein QAD02_000801 [Eretmocerus hayati]
MASDDNSIPDNVPDPSCTLDIAAIAREIKLGTLPTTSRNNYQKKYNAYLDWCKANKIEEYLSENALLVYLQTLKVDKNYAASTIRATHSMIKACMKAYDNKDVGGYIHVNSFMKTHSKRHKPKKSYVFTALQLQQFFQNASNEEYLLIKALVAVGVIGCCRKGELVKMLMSYVTAMPDAYLIRIPAEVTKTLTENTFMVVGPFYTVLKRYLEARKKINHERFFLTQRDGVFINSPAGDKTVSNAFKVVATFLKLPEPERYTGHCIRRTSATVYAETSCNDRELMRHGRWKNIQCASGYVQDTRFIGEKVSRLITNAIVPDQSPELDQSSTSARKKPANKRSLPSATVTSGMICNEMSSTVLGVSPGLQSNASVMQPMPQYPVHPVQIPTSSAVKHTSSDLIKQLTVYQSVPIMPPPHLTNAQVFTLVPQLQSQDQDLPEFFSSDFDDSGLGTSVTDTKQSSSIVSNVVPQPVKGTTFTATGNCPDESVLPQLNHGHQLPVSSQSAVVQSTQNMQGSASSMLANVQSDFSQLLDDSSDDETRGSVISTHPDDNQEFEQDTYWGDNLFKNSQACEPNEPYDIVHNSPAGHQETEATGAIQKHCQRTTYPRSVRLATVPVSAPGFQSASDVLLHNKVLADSSQLHEPPLQVNNIPIIIAEKDSSMDKPVFDCDKSPAVSSDKLVPPNSDDQVLAVSLKKSVSVSNAESLLNSNDRVPEVPSLTIPEKAHFPKVKGFDSNVIHCDNVSQSHEVSTNVHSNKRPIAAVMSKEVDKANKRSGSRSEVSQANEAVRETEITKVVNDDHDQRVQEIMRELVNSSEEDSALKSSDWLSQFDLLPITLNMSTRANYNKCGHSHDAGSSMALQYELLGNQESVNDSTLKSMDTTNAFQYYEHATSSGYMIDESNNETYTHGLPCYNENNIWRSTQLLTRDGGAISAPMDQCEYNITEKIDEYKNGTTSYPTDNAEGRNITPSGLVFNLHGNTLPGANRSTNTNIGSSGTNANSASATAINLGSDTPPAPSNAHDNHDVPSVAGQSNNTDDSRPKRKRYSTRTYQDTSNCNSRDKTVRTRYPDICKLGEQTQNSCPDLNHPSWEIIENFSCKRSVFYRKDRSGIICHLSYFKEKHEPMGFQIDSKHILIKSNENPQMPTGLECHNNYCEVKGAVKCGYCVKAYFELMLESEQGEREEIIDKWDSIPLPVV